MNKIRSIVVIYDMLQVTHSRYLSMEGFNHISMCSQSPVIVLVGQEAGNGYGSCSHFHSVYGRDDKPTTSRFRAYPPCSSTHQKQRGQQQLLLWIA